MPTIKMEPEIVCVICGKSQAKVKRLIAASTGMSTTLYLCDACVTLCYELIQEKELDADAS